MNFSGRAWASLGDSTALSRQISRGDFSIGWGCGRLGALLHALVDVCLSANTSRPTIHLAGDQEEYGPPCAFDVWGQASWDKEGALAAAMRDQRNMWPLSPALCNLKKCSITGRADTWPQRCPNKCPPPPTFSLPQHHTHTHQS